MYTIVDPEWMPYASFDSLQEVMNFKLPFGTLWDDFSLVKESQPHPLDSIPF